MLEMWRRTVGREGEKTGNWEGVDPLPTSLRVSWVAMRSKTKSGVDIFHTAPARSSHGGAEELGT